MHTHQHSRPQVFLLVGLFLVTTAAGQVAKPSHEQAVASASTPLVSHPPEQVPMPEERARITGSYRKLPLSFEANQGQVDARVKFLSRGANYTVFLAADEAVLTFPIPAQEPMVSRSADTRNLPPGVNPENLTPAIHRVLTEAQPPVQMKLIGANEGATLEGLNPLPGKINYFLGNDPQKWRTNVPTYAKVKAAGIYPGIDLVYYGNQQQLEYDFVVWPGADPHAVRLAFQGIEGLVVSPEGDLLLKIEGQLVRFRKPDIYQPDPESADGGGRALVDGHYVVEGRNTITFEVAHYDKARPLVIDPVLQYSTYLGGSNRDTANAVAVDGSGNFYLTGTTRSANFPVTASSIQHFSGGLCGVQPCRDIFVTKFNPQGSALIYSTFIGGTNDDTAQHITLDASGNAYITGATLSADFPTTIGAFHSTFGGAGSFNTGDAFVTKLNATGSALVYSTYLGGSGDEQAFTVAVDSAGNAYVTGFTTSSDFPSTPGAYRTSCTNSPCYDAFVTKLNPTGTALVYSTFLGGSVGGIINSASGLAIDSAGNAYVGGTTGNFDFPATAFAFKTRCGTDDACNGTQDGFIAKLNPSGSALIYSTFLGSDGFDNVNSIAIDPDGNVYATGSTVSVSFPITIGAAQDFFAHGSGCTTYNCGDAFVTKLNATGTALVYSTFLGGEGDDGGVGLALDSSNHAYVSGVTSSLHFPAVNAVQSTYGGGVSDGFLTVVNPEGTAFSYSTFLGGSGQDFSNKVAVDCCGNAYVVGGTVSTDFPVTAGAFQAHNAGLLDAFIVKIHRAADLTISITTTAPPSVHPVFNFPYVIAVTNLGPDTADDVVVHTHVPDGTFFGGFTFGTTGTGAWTCNLPAEIFQTGEIRCTKPFLQKGSSTIAFLVVSVLGKDQPQPGSTIAERVTVSSSTFDPTGADNKATVSTNVIP